MLLMTFPYGPRKPARHLDVCIRWESAALNMVYPSLFCASPQRHLDAHTLSRGRSLEEKRSSTLRLMEAGLSCKT